MEGMKGKKYWEDNEKVLKKLNKKKIRFNYGLDKINIMKEVVFM